MQFFFKSSRKHVHSVEWLFSLWYGFTYWIVQKALFSLFSHLFQNSLFQIQSLIENTASYIGLHGKSASRKNKDIDGNSVQFNDRAMKKII